MENENNEVIIDSTENNEEKEKTEVENTEEILEKKEGEKPQETSEAKLARLKRQTAQLEKKLGIKNEVKSEIKKEQKSDDLDYGEKAFLRSYEIKGADEIALVKNWVKRTGDELDVVVEDEIFQSKLKSLREAKASADAIPKGKTRTTQQAQNDEQYWTAKIESGQAQLNDIEDVNMRRKVLNRRIEHEKSGNKFSSQPIVIT